MLHLSSLLKYVQFSTHSVVELNFIKQFTEKTLINPTAMVFRPDGPTFLVIHSCLELLCYNASHFTWILKQYKFNRKANTDNNIIFNFVKFVYITTDYHD